MHTQYVISVNFVGGCMPHPRPFEAHLLDDMLSNNQLVFHSTVVTKRLEGISRVGVSRADDMLRRICVLVRFLFRKNEHSGVSPAGTAFILYRPISQR